MGKLVWFLLLMFMVPLQKKKLDIGGVVGSKNQFFDMEGVKQAALVSIVKRSQRPVPCTLLNVQMSFSELRFD